MLTSGKGKYKVFLKKHKHNDDLIYVLGGGEKPHIGAVVLCEPNKKPQLMKIKDHYDYVVLLPIAEVACKKYKTRVVAVGGVHVDNATSEEIDLLVKNCNALVKRI